MATSAPSRILDFQIDKHLSPSRYVPSKVRVLIVHAHEIVRAGLGSILRNRDENEIVGESADAREAVELARQLNPDLVVIGNSMPRLNGVEAIRQILHEFPQMKVIAVADEVNEVVVSEALHAGACSILLRDSAAIELTLALRAAREGTTYLSPGIGKVVMQNYLNDRSPLRSAVLTALTSKQREVLQLIADGTTNKEIARQLNISIKTVESHRAEIMKKLNIHTVAGLTKYAIREGLSSVDA